ncbi:hypothetical protein OMVG_00218 [Ostreococcus lucimarinus virus OlV3]|nr:hypothetical protein OMVG_00218 [Ostreococcus lucimarinus virus OlV3]
MISTLRQPTLVLPKKRSRRCITHAKIRDYPKFAEAVNGRVAMYGMVMGSTNWGLFGMNIVDQLYYPPTAALTAITSAMVIYTMADTANKVPEETFERYATRDYGRVAMFVMTGMILASLT